MHMQTPHEPRLQRMESTNGNLTKVAPLDSWNIEYPDRELPPVPSKDGHGHGHKVLSKLERRIMRHGKKQGQSDSDHPVPVDAQATLKPPPKDNRLSRRETAINKSVALPGADYVVQCQLAHGSPTGLLTDLHSIRDLYDKIADCYNITADEIMFCTLNTKKVNTNRLLGSLLDPAQFIFAHLKGQKKEIELIKDEPLMGLTVTDNGLGCVIIKRVKAGSLVDRLAGGCIRAGDHVNKINDESMVGKRHVEVARALRDLPMNCSFRVKLIEPLSRSQSDDSISSRPEISGIRRNRTIRLKATGSVIIQDNQPRNPVVDRVNIVLESYLGISDDELAHSLLEECEQHKELEQWCEWMYRSDQFSIFELPKDVLVELWEAVHDTSA